MQRVDPQRGGRPFLVLAAELGQNDVEFRDLRVVQADLDRFALAGSLGIAAIVEIAPPTCRIDRVLGVLYGTVPVRRVEQRGELHPVASRTDGQSDVGMFQIAGPYDAARGVFVDRLSVSLVDSPVDRVEQRDSFLQQRVFAREGCGHLVDDVGEADALALREVSDRVVEIFRLVAVFLENRGIDVDAVGHRNAAEQRLAEGVRQENVARNGHEFVVRNVARAIARARRERQNQNQQTSCHTFSSILISRRGIIARTVSDEIR